MHYLFAGPAFLTNIVSGNAMCVSYAVPWHRGKYNA
jgi:hypothetical protein